MNIEQIDERLQEIRSLVKSDEVTDYDKIETEITELEEQRKALVEQSEKRSQVLSRIAENDMEVRSVANYEEIIKPEAEVRYNAESPEYRSAWLKFMLDDGQEWTEAEERAFTHTTENTGQVVPNTLVEKIYNNMAELHPLLGDVNKIRSMSNVSIVKHVAIAAGDAKAVAENEANVDEENTFINVDITVKDYSKHLEISYRLAKMSISSFESYLVSEIAQRLAKVRTADILDTIKNDAVKGLAASQKISVETAGTLTAADVRAGLALLKGVGRVNLYMNRSTFYNTVGAMTDTNIVSYTKDFQTQIPANLFGYPIKIEDEMADGDILFLDPSQYTDNIIQDVMIERDRDIKRHVHIISGLTIAGGTMTNELGGVLLSVGDADVTP